MKTTKVKSGFLELMGYRNEISHLTDDQLSEFKHMMNPVPRKQYWTPPQQKIIHVDK